MKDGRLSCLSSGPFISAFYLDSIFGLSDAVNSLLGDAADDPTGVTAIYNLRVYRFHFELRTAEDSAESRPFLPAEYCTLA